MRKKNVDASRLNTNGSNFHIAFAAVVPNCKPQSIHNMTHKQSKYLQSLGCSFLVLKTAFPGADGHGRG